MKNFSRREFLQSASIVSIGLSPSPATSLPLPAKPDLTFPPEPRARLAVTSWPFREFIDSPTNRYRRPETPRMDLKDFPGMVATKFGVHNICPLAAHFRSTDPAYLEAFRQSVQQAGSHLVDLGLGQGSFWDSDSAKRQKALGNGQQGIDLAVQLGSPSIRQHLGGPRGGKPDVELASQTLGRLADYGAGKNILINLENDNLH